MLRTSKFLIGVAAVALAAPALSQTLPDRRNLDENGVDLVHGDVLPNFVEATIGSGEAAVSLVRYSSSNRGTNWDQVSFKLSNDNLDNRLIAEIGRGDGSVDRFYVVQGWQFAPFKGDGSRLEGRRDRFTYTGRDGTKIEFGWPEQFSRNSSASNLCQWDDFGFKQTCTLVPIEIRHPNGTAATFKWQAHESGTGNMVRQIDTRLSVVVNSNAYGLQFGYQTVGLSASTPAPAEWWNRTHTLLTTGGIEQSRVDYSYPSPGRVDVTPSGRGTSIFEQHPGSITITESGKSSASFKANTANPSHFDIINNGIHTVYSRSVSGSTVTLVKKDVSDNQTVYVGDLSKSVITSVTDPLGKTARFTYDGFARNVRSTDKSGGYVEYVYDARGNITRTTIVPAPGSNQPPIITSAIYPINCDNPVTCNQPVQTIDAGNRATDYTYNQDHGGVVTVTAPAMPNGIRPQTRYEYDLIIGNVTKVHAISTCRTKASCIGTDDETRQTLRYDQQGNVTEMRIQSGDGALIAQTTSTYSWLGDLLSQDGPRPGSADTTSFRYDAARRLTEIAQPDQDEGGPLPRPSTRMRYDQAGRLLTKEIGSITSNSLDWSAFQSRSSEAYEYDLNDNVSSATLMRDFAPITRSQFSYDALGRPACSVTRMNPATWNAAPSAACTPLAAGSDGSDRVVADAYDALGRLTSIRSGVGTPDERRESATYDDSGQVTSLTDGAGNRTSFEYDGFGRRTKTIYPTPSVGSGASSPSDYEELRYDSAGLIGERRLRDGTVFSYTYDAFGHVTSKVVSNSATIPASSNRSVFYGYDLNGRLEYARFDSHQGEGVSFTYNSLGAVTGSTSTMGGIVRTMHYEYDSSGNRTKLIYPDNVQIDYAYNAAGDMTQAWWTTPGGGRTPFLNITYDALGNRSNVNRGSSHTGYTIDGSGRLAQQNQRFANGLGNTDVAYSYNPAGQLSSRNETNGDYSYRNRLPVDRAYTANGLNQYSSVGPNSYAYDARGNLASDGQTAYVYDADNRLVSTSSGVSLSYDPLGRLWQISTSSSATRFLYDGDDLVAEYDPSGRMLRRHVHGAATDEVILTDEGGAMSCSGTRFLHPDERGSIIATSDCNGNRTASNSYDESGIPTSNIGRFQYTGQIWLDELRMYHYKARLYSPTLGRFMQTDPSGYGDGANLYQYAQNDAVNMSDPDGLYAVPIIYVTAPKLVAVIPGIAKGVGSVLGAILGFSSGGAKAAAARRAAEEASKQARINQQNQKPQNGIAVGADANIVVTAQLPSCGLLCNVGRGLGIGLIGAQGEAAVRARFDIGPKVKINVDGQVRFPDGLNDTTLSEVKNVSRLSYTSQLKSYVTYSQRNGLQFDLYVRSSTRLSSRLLGLQSQGVIRITNIPGM